MLKILIPIFAACAILVIASPSQTMAGAVACIPSCPYSNSSKPTADDCIPNTSYGYQFTCVGISGRASMIHASLRCSTTTGTIGAVGNPVATNGVNCWCRVDVIAGLPGAGCSASEPNFRWVRVGAAFSDIGGCQGGCRANCNGSLTWMATSMVF